MFNKNRVTLFKVFSLCLLMGQMYQMYGMHLCKRVAKSGAPRRARAHTSPRAHRFFTTDSKTLTIKPEELVKEYVSTAKKLKTLMEDDPALEAFRFLRKKIDLEYATKSKKDRRDISVDNELFLPFQGSFPPGGAENIRHWNETMWVRKKEAQHKEIAYGTLKNELKKIEHAGEEVGLFEKRPAFLSDGDVYGYETFSKVIPAPLFHELLKSLSEN